MFVAREQRQRIRTNFLRLALTFTACIAGALAGCADFTPPLTPPARGGSKWTELTSKHLTLFTDVKVDEARRLLTEFETTYRVLVDNELAVDPSDGQRIQVILFERAIDSRKFAWSGQSRFSLRTFPNDPEPTAAIALQGSATVSTRRKFTGGLTHYLVARTLPTAPAWFQEGLAFYYSTLRIDDDAAYIGSPPSALPLLHGLQSKSGMRLGPSHIMRVNGFSRVCTLRTSKVPPPSELVQLNRDEFYGDRADSPFDRKWAPFFKFSGAWSLVHMLHQGPAPYPARYATFMDALRDGIPSPEAWAMAFRDTQAANLDRDFAAYVDPTLDDSEIPLERQIPAPSPTGMLQQERTMSDAQVHLLWARLRDWQTADSTAAYADIENAMARDRSSPEPLFWRAWFHARSGRFHDAEKEFSRLLDQRPNEPRYWLAFGMALRAEMESLQPTSNPNAQRLEAISRRLADAVEQLRRTATTRHQREFVAIHEELTATR